MNERNSAESAKPQSNEHSSKSLPSRETTRNSVLNETSKRHSDFFSKTIEQPKPVGDHDKRLAEGPGSSKEAIAARESLVRHHLCLAGFSGDKATPHVDGWDLTKPVYERHFEEGERLIQDCRNTSAEHPTQETGRYFGIPGDQKMGHMGIGSGVAGRSRQEFIVARPCVGLEGTAQSMTPEDRKNRSEPGSDTSGNLDKLDFRGAGGASQVFFADRGLSCLRPSDC